MAMQAAKSFLFFTRMKSQKPEDLTIERLTIDGSSGSSIFGLTIQEVAGWPIGHARPFKS